MKVIPFEDRKLALFHETKEGVNYLWYLFELNGELYGANIQDNGEEGLEKAMIQTAKGTLDTLKSK